MAKVELLKIIISTQLPALFTVSLPSSCTSTLSLSLCLLELPRSLSFRFALVSLTLVECAQLVCTHVNSDLKPFYLRFIPFYFVLPPYALCSVREPVQVHWFAQFACCAFDFAFKTAAQKKIIQQCAK